MNKKVISMLLAGVLSVGAFSAFAGCGMTVDDGEEVDKNKTQLYVSNYNGGQGTAWLDAENSEDDLIGRFEEAYKDVSFEDGKMGVQVHVIPTKTKGATLISQMSGMEEEIFFSEDVPYGTAANAGRFLDVSDVIADIQASGDVSISQQRLTNLSVDGKYYGVPHYEIFDGITYDVDLFDDYMLYFSADGGFIKTANEEKAKGPDGEAGTWDDGLPATVNQFFELCDYMITLGITPMVWSGQYAFYFAHIFEAFCANYLSEDELIASYSYDSNGTETEIVTGFAANGKPNIERTAITPENGYLVYQSAARYYALDFMSRIYGNSGYYYGKSTASSVFSNADAQDVFVKSKLKGGDSKPIAMLVDGNWWYNEAKISIEESHSYGAASYNRKFGYFPIPTAQTEEQAAEGKEIKLLDRYSSYVFIKSNISSSKVYAAKTFLKFCYTAENCQQFTLDTGLHKAVNYTMTEAQMAELPYQTKQIMEYKMEHGSYDARSTSAIFLQNEGEIRTASVVGGSEYNYPTDAFKNKVSAQNYFKGMWKIADEWYSKYSKYFN